MKILIDNYIFDASAKTITFSDYGSIVLDGVLLVANVTDNIIIYNFASPVKGGSVLTNVLTLDYDTTAMDDTDDLLIYYDDTSYVQPISASSLPLPAGASTSSKQDDILTELATILNEATFTGRIGEVQASPTANTVLARLKDLLTGIVLAAGANIIGKVNFNGLIVDAVTDTTVDTSADLIFDCSARTDAVVLHISNCGTTTLYVGEDSSVTSSDYMYQIPPGQQIVIDHAGNTGTTEDLYGIRASGSALCKVVSMKYKT